MASSRDAYYIRVRAYLKLAGTTYDLSQIELKFELRDVGRAVVQIPVGRKCSESGMNTISNISKFLTDVYPLSKAEIWMKLTPAGGIGAPKGKKLGFPADKDFMVFSGYVQSPGQLKDISGTAAMTLSLFGSLGGLAGSTMFSRNFNLVPDNANSAVPVLMGNTKSDVASTVIDYFSKKYQEISQDLWWQGLYLIFLSTINENNLLWLNQPTGVSIIREALKRVNTGQFDKVKLRLKVENPRVEGYVNRSLSWMFANAVFILWKYGKGGSGGDLLSIVSELQDELQYTLSPGIDHDGLLPLCGMLGLNYGDVIEPSEYSAESVRLHFKDDDFSYMTSVGILPATANYTHWQDAPTKGRFVGFNDLFRLAKKPKDLPKWPTRIVMQMARPWMMPPPADAVSGNNASRPLPDSHNPKEVPPPPTSDQIKKQQHLEEEYLLAKLGSNYAGAYLANNLFRNRTMTFTGRLRFDICAGSTIGIRLVEDMFTSKSAGVLYGLVESVKIDVGVGNGSPRATTTFVLSSVRTQEEHNTLTVQKDMHPMFISPPFIGAPLTEEAAS
jgi:hypothetical protein